MAKELSFEVDRRPYLRRPDHPPEGEPRRQIDGETETEVNPAMQERAKGVGLDMRRPHWSPNPMRVHEATIYAKEKGRDSQFHHLAAGAYWETGADLNDMDVLKGIAESAGLDWADLGPRIESGEFSETVIRESEAAKEKGVSVSPTYQIGGEFHRGDVGIDELREAIQSAAAGAAT